jgi:hypothetical protein
MIQILDVFAMMTKKEQRFSSCSFGFIYMQN